MRRFYTKHNFAVEEPCGKLMKNKYKKQETTCVFFTLAPQTAVALASVTSRSIDVCWPDIHTDAWAYKGAAVTP
ncbi:hypothetical protein MnBA_00840 [Marinobacterium sp. BA1]